MADEDIKSNEQPSVDPVADKTVVETVSEQPVGEVVPDEQPKTESVEMQSGVGGVVSEPSVIVESPVVELPAQANSPEFIPEPIPNTPTNPIPEIAKPEPTPVIPEVAVPITTTPEPTPTTAPVVPVVNTDVPSLTNPTIRTYLMGLLVKANSAIQVRKQKKLQNILALFNTMPKVQNDDVEKKLHISDTMATQYLATLVKQGHIKRAGTGRNTYYFKP